MKKPSKRVLLAFRLILGKFRFQAATPEELVTYAVDVVSKHPIRPVVRVAIWLLRWPFYVGPILLGAIGAERPQYAAPLQKQFYRPIFVLLWVIVALLPFVLIRRRIPYLIYCAAFCIIGGWLLYDLVVPFRYVAPDFHGEIEDSGGSYTIRGSPSQGYQYWITRFVPSSVEDWLMVLFLLWPFLIGSIYHALFSRGEQNRKR